MHTHKYRKGLESDSPSFRLFLRTYVLQGTNLLKIWEMEVFLQDLGRIKQTLK